MQPENYQIVAEIFQKAVQLPSRRRDEFLDQACQGDLQLRRQVEGMLTQDDRLGSDEFGHSFWENLELTPSNEATVDFRKDAQSRQEQQLRLTQLGEYELLEEIARGGMGVVFKARHRELNRIVAVKLILSSRLASKESIRRFQTEAKAAARLDHPGLVPVYEVGHEQGQHFLAMGYVDGESLSERLNGGPLEPDKAAEIVLRLAQAVEYAHQHGVIHRDLKPSNVLMDSNDRPRITDFGLAKQIDDQEGLTVTGDILGTPSYMSPEQASGGAISVGPQSDIYSLGAILYTALTGRPPFNAASILETINQILETEPVSPRTSKPGLPKSLETICLKCLSKKPNQRYATAGELAEDLRRYLDGEAIHARPTNVAQRMIRWARRYPGFTVVLVPLTILYAYHLLVAFGLNRVESRAPFFHWFATGLVVVWLTGAWVFQQLILRAPYRRWIGFAWSTMDVVFLTSYLFVASKETLSPNYVAYIGLVAASAIRFRIGVQYFTTALCAIAYLVFVWKGTPSQPPQFPETIFQVVPFLVQLLVIGLIQALLLRRIRRVDRPKLRDE